MKNKKIQICPNCKEIAFIPTHLCLISDFKKDLNEGEKRSSKVKKDNQINVNRN
jgi:hypothetical protein